MLEVRGKFIRLAGLLMTLYPEQRDKADRMVYEATGKHWDELEPAEWYDVKIYRVFLDAYASSSVTGQKALLTLGKKIFPTKKKLGELPADITTPMDLLIYSTKSFTEDHRGPGIRPVKVIRVEERYVIFGARCRPPDTDRKTSRDAYFATGLLRSSNVENIS